MKEWAVHSLEHLTQQRKFRFPKPDGSVSRSVS